MITEYNGECQIDRFGHIVCICGNTLYTEVARNDMADRITVENVCNHCGRIVVQTVYKCALLQ